MSYQKVFVLTQDIHAAKEKYFKAASRWSSYKKHFEALELKASEIASDKLINSDQEKIQKISAQVLALYLVITSKQGGPNAIAALADIFEKIFDIEKLQEQRHVKHLQKFSSNFNLFGDSDEEEDLEDPLEKKIDTLLESTNTEFTSLFFSREYLNEAQQFFKNENAVKELVASASIAAESPDVVTLRTIVKTNTPPNIVYSSSSSPSRKSFLSSIFSSSPPTEVTSLVQQNQPLLSEKTTIQYQEASALIEDLKTAQSKIQINDNSGTGERYNGFLGKLIEKFEKIKEEENALPKMVSYLFKTYELITDELIATLSNKNRDQLTFKANERIQFMLKEIVAKVFSIKTSQVENAMKEFVTIKNNEITYPFFSRDYYSKIENEVSLLVTPPLLSFGNTGSNSSTPSTSPTQKTPSHIKT